MDNFWCLAVSFRLSAIGCRPECLFLADSRQPIAESLYYTLLLCIAVLALIGHGYFWVGLVNRIHAWAGPRWIVDYTTHLCVIAFVGIPLSICWSLWYGFSGPLAAEVKSNLGLNGAQVGYIELCALVGGAMLLIRLLGPKKSDLPDTLLHCQKELLDVTASTSVAPLKGLSARLLSHVPGNQMLSLSIERKRLAIPRLSAALDGLTIAHISDLHMTGRIGPEFFQIVAEQVNALQPDIIALTGDIIENDACRPWIADTLGQMHAKQGKYFILGNHDKFVDFEQTRKMLVELDWTYVGGLCLQAEWNGESVVVAGNELPWFSPAPKMLEVPERQSNNLPLRLMLIHSPDQFAWCCEYDADLVLAGHTHGGQVCFPVLGPVACPSIYGTRYAGGVYRTANTVMHVTRGISGETPIRWNCPPEIALLELKVT